jgi:hypothetical protein
MPIDLVVLMENLQKLHGTFESLAGDVLGDANPTKRFHGAGKKWWVGR